MTALAGFIGQVPGVRIERPVNPERAGWMRLWAEHPDAREHCEGEALATMFMSQSAVGRDDTVIDFGCGTGRGGLMLALFGACKVTLMDFAPNCLDHEVADACKNQSERIRFEEADLIAEIPRSAAYGYCVDVMQHIPQHHVANTLRNILGAAQHVFFKIQCWDNPNSDIGITVKPASWWIEQLQELGAMVHWAHSDGTKLAIYCTAWYDGKQVLVDGKVNTDHELLDAQVRENIAGGWSHVHPHQKQDREVILLAGGPSTKRFLPEIRDMRDSGMALVTVNGAYNWAIENGLKPSVQIVIDAREFNGRFVHPVLEGTKYLMASQVHPSTLKGLPRDRTLLWHAGLSVEQAKLAQEAAGYYFPVPGGSTVVLRALPLLRMLGMWRFHMFGFDSCLLDGEHHAYPQPENDSDEVTEVSCAGKTFTCTAWQLSQAQEFADLVRLLGDEVELAVYGPGLIAHMLEKSATLSKE